MGRYLSTRQLKAIEMLLDDCTVELVQEKMNLRWGTLIRWREQPEFMARLNACKHALAEDLEYMKEKRMQELSCRTLHAVKEELFSDFACMKLIGTGLDVLKQVGKTPKRLETNENNQKRSKTNKNDQKPSNISTHEKI